jgi:hypothetical protein
MSDQELHVIIHCLIHHFSFAATFMYGFNTITARRALWDDLRRWSPNSPWLVLGDFNSMLSQEDKYNGAPVSSYEVLDFRECCAIGTCRFKLNELSLYLVKWACLKQT